MKIALLPFLFVADVSSDEDPDRAGRLEIVDGVQRIRTLTRFMTGELILSNLDRLKRLNGFTYFDFTIGAESFKRDLGATERPLFEKMVALSPRGLPLIMSSHLKRVARHSPRVAQSALGVFGMQVLGA